MHLWRAKGAERGESAVSFHTFAQEAMEFSNMCRGTPWGEPNVLGFVIAK
jgi:hypothetical protein